MVGREALSLSLPPSFSFSHSLSVPRLCQGVCSHLRPFPAIAWSAKFRDEAEVSYGIV